jgi:hypothetical protein
MNLTLQPTHSHFIINKDGSIVVLSDYKSLEALSKVSEEIISSIGFWDNRLRHLFFLFKEGGSHFQTEAILKKYKTIPGFKTALLLFLLYYPEHERPCNTRIESQQKNGYIYLSFISKK